MIAFPKNSTMLFDLYFKRGLSLGLEPAAAEDAASGAVLEAWRAESRGYTKLTMRNAAVGFARAVTRERRQPVTVDPGEAVRMYEASCTNGTQGLSAHWVHDEIIDENRLAGLHETLGISEDGYALYVDGLTGLTMGPNLDFSRMSSYGGGHRVY